MGSVNCSCGDSDGEGAAGSATSTESTTSSPSHSLELRNVSGLKGTPLHAWPVRIGKPRVTVVLGGPGSGKGTMCGLILNKLLLAGKEAGESDGKVEHLEDGSITLARVFPHCWAHVSVGAALRSRAAHKLLHPDVVEAMHAGQLVPHRIIVELVHDVIANLVADHGVTEVLLDGFPRHVDQVEAFESSTPYTIAHAVYLNCSVSRLRRRLRGRAEASGDAGRADDADADVIERRLRVHEKCAPAVLDAFATRGILSDVDAGGGEKAAYGRFESAWLRPL